VHGVVDRGVDLGERRPDPTQKPGGRVGGLDTISPSDEEFDAEGPLEPGDGVADRRLPQAESEGGAGEAARIEITVVSISVMPK